ncbi:MAG: poly-gamma-glutamate system protein [Calditrichia bacterium]|nr:poly-gamma-glutamate system protein [Calditrichia bacterium]
MYKFSSKSNIVLGVLLVIAVLAFISVEYNKVLVKQNYYGEKLEAAKLSALAAKAIKDYRLEKGIFIDPINDPNRTALIGQEYTLTTTDRGDVDSKLSSTNPNFAAVIVEMLKEAEINAGEKVAVALTGSFPALNISLLSALETMNIEPIIITSIGASNWGANDPYFTWLDMEAVLNKANIYHHKSIAASLGGGMDIGRGLSPEGRQLIKDAIMRNNVELIEEEFLNKSIDKRIEIYKSNSVGKSIKAYINVGGGIASLGNSINGDLIPSGLSLLLPMKNYPVRGVIIKMANEDIPIIHLLNIKNLLKQYGLPESPVPLPEPGVGKVFVHQRYSMLITAIATSFLMIAISLVVYSDRKKHQLGSETIPVVGKTDEESDSDAF